MWAEIKGILITQATPPPDEASYIFTDSWAAVDGLNVSLKTAHWQIRDTYCCGCELWEHIMAADNCPGHSHRNPHSGPIFWLDSNCQLSFCLPDCYLRFLDPSSYWTWQHIHYQRLSTKERKLYVSDAEVTTTCEGWVPAINDTFFLRWGGPHCMGCYLYKLLAKWTNRSF